MTQLINDLNTEIIGCRKCARLVEWREQVARVKRKAYKDHDYWGKPVPGFGDPQARVFVVGLAPGAHGSNRTGRQFTGDASGNFLYPALYRAGFISNVGAWSPPVGEGSPNVGEGSPNVGQGSPDVGQGSPDVGQGSPDVGEGSPNVGQGSPNVGQGSPDRSRPIGPQSRDDGLTLTDMYIAAVCRCAPPDNKPLPEEMSNCQPYLERELALIAPKVIVALGRIAFESILRIYSLRSSGMIFGHGATVQLPNGIWLICSYHPSQQNTQTGKLTVAMFDAIWQKAKDLLNPI